MKIKNCGCSQKKDLYYESILCRMGTIEELFSICDRWNSAGRARRFILVVLAVITILIMSFLFIIYADQATSVIEKRNISEKIAVFSGGIMAGISYFDVVLILSVIFLIIILSIIIVYIANRTRLSVARARAETNATASKLIEQQDQNTKDILELANMCDRLKDNLRYKVKAEEENEKRARDEQALVKTVAGKKHEVKSVISAHINLEEDTSDLLKEADAILYFPSFS